MWKKEKMLVTNVFKRVNDPEKETLLEISWKKEKMLVYINMFSFPQHFLPFQKTNFHSSVTCILSSANASNLDKAKTLSSDEVLTNISSVFFFFFLFKSESQ